MNNGQKSAVLDIDDIMVDLSTEWVTRAYKDQELLPFLKIIDTDKIREQVFTRNRNYVQDFFLTEEGISRADVVDRFNNLYRKDPTFYDKLDLTVFGRSIKMALEIDGYVSEVHFITHNFSNDDPSVESKERFINRFFGMYGERVRLHQLVATEKKADLMERVCPEPNIFADDQPKNVIPVILNEKLRPHEIAMPRFGYNTGFAPLPDNAIALARLRRIRLNLYTP